MLILIQFNVIQFNIFLLSNKKQKNYYKTGLNIIKHFQNFIKIKI